MKECRFHQKMKIMTDQTKSREAFARWNKILSSEAELHRPIQNQHKTGGDPLCTPAAQLANLRGNFFFQCEKAQNRSEVTRK